MHVDLSIDCEGQAGDCSAPRLQQGFRTAWKPPNEIAIDDSRVFRMIQIVESWFAADRDCLRRRYGQGFQESVLPNRHDIEATPKQDVFDGLQRATQKKAFKKGWHDGDLLRRLDPRRVRAQSAECGRICRTLTAVLAAA